MSGLLMLEICYKYRLSVSAKQESVHASVSLQILTTFVNGKEI